MLNNEAILDTRQVITGKDGQLFVTTRAGNNIFLAEVDTFSAQVNVTNVDYQPVGSSLVYAVSTGYSMSLTFSEVVVRDDVMLSELIEDLQEGYFPYWQFKGKLRRRDGMSEQLVFRNCILDGTLDLMGINPGDIIKRSWSFRVNHPPEKITLFM